MCPATAHDLFLPVQTPWQDADRKIASMKAAYRSTADAAIPHAAASEDDIFELLFEVVRHKRHHATYMPPIKPTVAEFLANPDNLTTVLDRHDPDFPIFTEQEIVDCKEDVARAGGDPSLGRCCCTTCYPWDRSRQRLARPHEIGDDDFVIVFEPRNREVLEFINRVKEARQCRRSACPRSRRRRAEATDPALSAGDRAARSSRSCPGSRRWPRSPGEQVCTNEDVIRNSAMNWSPMTAEEISSKTGIEERLLHQPRDRGDFARRRAQRAQALRPGARGDRCGPVLLMHEHPADPFGGDLAFGRARYLPDAQFQRHRRGLRRHALWPVGGAAHPAMKSTARCCSSAPRSSRTRSAMSAPRACCSAMARRRW